YLPLWFVPHPTTFPSRHKRDGIAMVPPRWARCIRRREKKPLGLFNPRAGEHVPCAQGSRRVTRVSPASGLTAVTLARPRVGVHPRAGPRLLLRAKTWSTRMTFKIKYHCGERQIG